LKNVQVTLVDGAQRRVAAGADRRRDQPVVERDLRIRGDTDQVPAVAELIRTLGAAHAVEARVADGRDGHEVTVRPTALLPVVAVQEIA